MKFGIVTDLHAGDDFNTKCGSRAVPLLKEALESMKRQGCDLVIDLGDRISERGREADLTAMSVLRAIFDRSGLEHHHLCGNHDLYGLDLADNEGVFGPCGSRLVERDGISLALFHGDMDSLEARMRFTLSAAGLAELEALLAAARWPTVLFTHVPLLSRSMEGSFYFERAWNGSHCYANGTEIRSVLEAAPKLLACIAGHVHWSSHMAVDGIHFCTVGSLTETFASHPEPEAAHAIVELGDRLVIDVHGQAPIGFVLPLRKPGHRWLNMDRPGAPRPPHLSERYRRAFAQNRG